MNCVHQLRRPLTRTHLWCVLVLLIVLSLQRTGSLKTGKVYTNRFAVHIQGGHRQADEVARKHGFVNHGQIGSLDGYYLFEHHAVKKRSLSHSHYHHKRLQDEEKVHWFEQQYAKRRTKRDLRYEDFSTTTKENFPDPLFQKQWYLVGGASGGYDMNVKPVWKRGYTGKGVVVTILDDGIQTNHPDLMQNYDSLASIDINDNDDDPMPQNNGDNKHGTRCAGEVAATAYNDYCGVGVAYNASIGGVRMLDGTVTDDVEARALSLNPDHIDIYSASWGPEDDGKTVDGPGRLARQAFLQGISKGRHGLGSIFVWASGNGGRYNDNCNCDGYTNSIYTLSISSATQHGSKPWYLEECSSTLATTYSSGSPGTDENIVTVDMDLSFKSNTLCTQAHTGTSASAPIAAGIAALVLEANPKLTWRDMQHLVVMSSRPEPLLHEPGWITNGVGRKVSHKFGYGLMDADKMVSLAEKWVNVPPQHTCETNHDRYERIIPEHRGHRLEVSLNTSACASHRNEVKFLEHVEVVIDLEFSPRGNLRITLVSPRGTASSVLLPRQLDVEEKTFEHWPFMSVHFWGEPAAGEWKLIIHNEGKTRVTFPGKLKEWYLVLHGTNVDPANLKGYTASALKDPQVPNKAANRRYYRCSVEGKYSLEGVDGKCVDKCPVGMYGDHQKLQCQQCHTDCDECFGPANDNCLSCKSKMFLYSYSCIFNCPEGFYEDRITRQCVQCASGCVNCQDNFFNCSSCKKELLLHNHTCVASCPDGTYPSKEERRCKQCPENCDLCTPDLSMCIRCRNGYYLKESTCSPDCPEGYFIGEDQQCYRCQAPCETCNSLKECTSCVSGFNLQQNGKCEGDYPRCHHTCKQCYGANDNQCILCSSSRYWNNGYCVLECPNGYYSDPDGRCIPCSEHCRMCDRTNKCHECLHSLILFNSSCTSQCPEGFYISNTSGKPECSPCHSSCKTCFGGGAQNCASCPSGKHLYESRCLTECPVGTYIRSSQPPECIKCHSSCSACHGPGPLACTSCSEHAFFVNQVCISCLSDEYLSRDRKCMKCNSSCRSCSGLNETECKNPSAAYLEKNRCLRCCTWSAETGACKKSDHTRSIIEAYLSKDNSGELDIPMDKVVPCVIGICVLAIVMFFAVFGFLQVTSKGYIFRRRVKDYERVPNPAITTFEVDSEKVGLTNLDDDDEEEEGLYEKT